MTTYSATDPESATITWSLEGDDAADFEISDGGVLTFKSSPDYETAADDDTDNAYMVTVKANDGTNTATRDVTVTVTNVDEDGEVTLSAAQPVVDTELTATLADPDGGVTGTTWQWASSMDMTTWEDITGATMEAYTPVAADVPMYLRATAMYTDGKGSDKSAMGDSDNMVTALAISGMSSGEYAENGTMPVATYMAAGPEAEMASWTLEGDDAGLFGILGGVLSFNSPPDYEKPGGHGHGQHLHGHRENRRRDLHGHPRRDGDGHQHGRDRDGNAVYNAATGWG